MKKYVLALLALIGFSSVSYGSWAYVPTSELLKETDLVLVGTLRSVSEETIDEIDHSAGIIVIDQIVSGNLRTTEGRFLQAGDRIRIRWQNPSSIACPRVEHKGAQNRTGIWLLRVEIDGTSSSDYPGRFMDLSQMAEIKADLRKVPIRKTQKTMELIGNSPVINIEQVTGGKTEGSFDCGERINVYPIRALTVAFLFTGLYFILYRSRFKIR